MSELSDDAHSPGGPMSRKPQPMTTSTNPLSEREEFCARFKAEMLRIAGPTFDDGDSIADYADETAPTYFDEPDQRAEGPEACAQADISYWEE